MPKTLCPHCNKRSIVAASDSVVQLNMSLEDHALCMWGNGWEICVTPGISPRGGQVIRDKAGRVKGTIWDLN